MVCFSFACYFCRSSYTLASLLVLILLRPLGSLLGSLMILREWLYAHGWLRRKTFDLPVIAIGNLSVGGTGKTPTTDWLVQYLEHTQRLSTVILSRGYGRRTRGFRWVQADDTPAQVGDEPLMLKCRAPQRRVAVCASRVRGVENILRDAPSTRVVVLDDAYQHLPLHAGRYLLLTSWKEPFFRDHPLPAGRLREPRRARHRANALLVTHTPEGVSEDDLQDFAQSCAMPAHVPVFFSRMGYREWRDMTGELTETPRGEKMLLVSGIARPRRMKAMLESLLQSDIELMPFRDHYNFRPEDLRRAAEYAQKKAVSRIITTEKDFMRLRQLSALSQWAPFQPVYPVMDLKLLPAYQETFQNWLTSYVAPN